MIAPLFGFDLICVSNFGVNKVWVELLFFRIFRSKSCEIVAERASEPLIGKNVIIDEIRSIYMHAF